MLQQRVTVHYLDGVEESAVITQADVRAFESWASRNGFAPSKAGRQLIQEMPVTFLRVGAWSALYRGVATGKASFDSWDATVVEVEAVDTPDVDPTQTVTPAEPSPE